MISYYFNHIDLDMGKHIHKLISKERIAMVYVQFCLFGSMMINMIYFMFIMI